MRYDVFNQSIGSTTSRQVRNDDQCTRRHDFVTGDADEDSAAWISAEIVQSCHRVLKGRKFVAGTEFCVKREKRFNIRRFREPYV